MWQGPSFVFLFSVPSCSCKHWQWCRKSFIVTSFLGYTCSYGPGQHSYTAPVSPSPHLPPLPHIPKAIKTDPWQTNFCCKRIGNVRPGMNSASLPSKGRSLLSKPRKSPQWERMFCRPHLEQTDLSSQTRNPAQCKQHLRVHSHMVHAALLTHTAPCIHSKLLSQHFGATADKV